MLKSDRTILTVMAKTQIDFVPMGVQAHNGRKGMPFELWEDVLLHAIQEKDPIDITQTNRGPWVFGRVCSHWRSIAFSRGKLWSSFSFTVRNTTSEDGGEIIPVRCYGTLLATVLAHSKALPLTFCVDFKDEAVGGILIPLLVSHIKRWRSVNIVSPRATFAPQLRSVGMDGFWMEGLPWMQLTELSIGSAAVWEVMDILRRCPQLRSLTLPEVSFGSGSLEDEESEDSDEGSDWGILTRAESDIHAIHESLESLNISEAPLLCFLELTSLKTLAIWGPILSDAEMRNEFSVISNFLTHSPSLRKIDISICSCSDSSFFFDLLYPRMPLLQELRIAFSWICDVQDLVLWFASFKSDVLPALKMVVIQCKDGSIDGDALEEWLYYRKIGELEWSASTSSVQYS
ncbi:hypothetical protein ARMSODRAFT_983938 [Armillaria solidipes]|uniref:F-box domain-containing protein n=1 Tax=Armillaria solidipes TaxID=1076256 RepID=A0A2H3AX17_9AGAR|nr:hypothetical protein ARMSODRAFT_983938 [Armillaria solidipes]